MIRNIRKALDRWAQKGHWSLVMLKTALTHSIVWGGVTFLGAMIGVLAIGLGGVRPVWASAIPLLTYALGARFYIDREFAGSQPDFVYADSLKERVDSLLDFVVPWIFSSVLLYGTFWLYLKL